MAKKKSALNVAIRATSSLFSSAVVVVPLALFFGTIVGFIDIGVLELVAPEARESAREAARLAESGIQIAPFPQSTMLKLMFRKATSRNRGGYTTPEVRFGCVL